MERVILKLSGEALGGKAGMGIDPEEIGKIALEIKAAYDLNKYQIGIVCGGGNFFRGRDAEKIGIERVECDYMGMMGTIMNGIALKNALTQIGVKAKNFTCLEVPAAVSTYTVSEANESLEEGYVCIFSGGTGKPYFSTDTATLLRAVDIKAKAVLMGKNGVDGVYTADPKVDKNAKKYDILTHREVLKENLQVMDLTAATIADENDIDIVVFNMDLENAIKRVLDGEKIGTIIKKEK